MSYVDDKKNLTMLNFSLNPNIDYYRDISGRFKFIKRVIRKLLRFLIEPAFHDITDFNNGIVKEIEKLRIELQDLQSTCNFLKEQNDYLLKNK